MNIFIKKLSKYISAQIYCILVYHSIRMSKLADPSEDDETMIPPFLGYSKQGSASGKLLYVNYGRTEDFDVLKKNFSISNCNGYIASMRYGKIFRGDKVFILFFILGRLFKEAVQPSVKIAYSCVVIRKLHIFLPLQVKNARECGAVGAILYNDPADFAPEGQDKVYPQYIWLPKTGVQRGSIFTSRGDPITPGLPSIDGVYRISPDDANLPEIPAAPMPYGDAVEIMKIMEGKSRLLRRLAQYSSVVSLRGTNIPVCPYGVFKLRTAL
jgi:hypothetical protein